MAAATACKLRGGFLQLGDEAQPPAHGFLAELGTEGILALAGGQVWGELAHQAPEDAGAADGQFVGGLAELVRRDGLDEAGQVLGLVVEGQGHDLVGSFVDLQPILRFALFVCCR